MNIDEFTKKYGTRSASIVLRRLADLVNDENSAIIREMADDLQAALEDYASNNFEPPTVYNEVV